jgi:hypothetical protein
MHSNHELIVFGQHAYRASDLRHRADDILQVPAKQQTESSERIPPNISRIEPLNHCYRSPCQAIGGRFSLSQRERAGVRENRSNQNVR